MKFSCFILIATFLMGLRAHAFLGPCELLSVDVPTSVNLSAAQIQDYKSKLQGECDLQKKYVDARSKAEAVGVRLEEISIYQAFRYVTRSFYIYNEYHDVPVELIFQRTKSQYSLPIEQRSSEIWNNWKIGIQQLPNTVASVAAGAHLAIADLETVHRGFYTLSDESGDFAQLPQPGHLKEAVPNDPPWWPLKTPEEISSTQAMVDSVNAQMVNMGLLPALAHGDPSDENLLIRVRNGSVYPASSRYLRAHLKNLLNFLNTMLDQARQNQPMTWKSVVMTPAQLAFFVQQNFVDIHGFHEGNGRTSRFLQELVLSLFGLPKGASGDLMSDDVLNPRDAYYQLAMKMTDALLDDVNTTCLLGDYAKQTGDIHKVNSLILSYRCRLLEN